jgi:hypothetical protein
MSGEGHLQARPLVHAPLEFRMRSAAHRPAAPSCCAPKRGARPSSAVRSITATVKHMNAHCTNTGCGHTFLMELSFVHSFNPGLIDRPDLNLKVCPREQSPMSCRPKRRATTAS